MTAAAIAMALGEAGFELRGINASGSALYAKHLKSGAEFRARWNGDAWDFLLLYVNQTYTIAAYSPYMLIYLLTLTFGEDAQRRYEARGRG